MPWRLTATLEDAGFESPVKRFFMFRRLNLLRVPRSLLILLAQSRSFGSGAHLGIREGLQFR